MTELFEIDSSDYHAGLLDWVEGGLSSSEGRVKTWIFADPITAKRTTKSRQILVATQLREIAQPFLRPLMHTDHEVDFLVDSIEEGNAFTHHLCSLSLPKLLGLPGEHPAQELENYAQFLRWLEPRRNHRYGSTVQCLRGGYNHRGLEWAGLTDAVLSDGEKGKWIQELADWRKKPWFAELYKKNMNGLARMRTGPHCWFRLQNLRQVSFAPPTTPARPKAP